MKCCACKGEGWANILERRAIPRSGQFLLEETQNFAASDLKWFGCQECGLIRLDASLLGPVDYTHVLRSTRNQLPAYCDDLIGLIAQRADGGAIIEIGANDGTFLRLVQKNGLNNLFGIEPSIAFREAYQRFGIPLINCHFTAAAVDNIRAVTGDAAVVICRHTLEHVPRPLEFLRSIRNLLEIGGGTVLIEVPDTRALASQCNVHELWDEHLYYFSEPNLRGLMKQSGLAVNQVRRYEHLGSENLIIVASRSETTGVAPDASHADVDVTRLSRRISDLVQRVATAGRNWRRPVVALGASHPQTNYLSISGAAQFVDCLLDDDRDKQGRYVPVAGNSPLAIISAEEAFHRLKPRTVLLTAFGYPQWIGRVQKQFRDCDTRFVDPYPPAGVGSD